MKQEQEASRSEWSAKARPELSLIKQVVNQGRKEVFQADSKVKEIMKL